MTLKNKNDFELFKVQVENSSFLFASNCKQVTIFKDGKIFVFENKSFQDVLDILKRGFEIANIY